MPKPSAKKTPVGQTERAVIYPELQAVFYLGDEALTCTQAKEILGWTEEPEKEKWKDEYMFVDEFGKKIQCRNNDHNRPFDSNHADKLSQDILNRYWADSRNGEGQVVGGVTYPRTINGESIIVDRTGITLSAQHRLVGFVRACQKWAKEEHWRQKWPDEPTMECLVILGVDGSEFTKRTLDNVKPRDLSDVLVSSGHFNKADRKELIKLSRVAANAVKLLWDRTGAKNDPYSPHRTHSESMEFIENHKKILRCVNHIVREDAANKTISKDYMTAGNAAALMYLMAASATDGEKYRGAEQLTEKHIDFTHFDAASEFWTRLNSNAPELGAIKRVIKSKENPESLATATFRERMGIIIKAWNIYITKPKSGLEEEKKWLTKHITEKEIDLEYIQEGDQTKLMDNPCIGGIDLPPTEQLPDDPTPEEIEAAEMEIRKEKLDAAQAEIDEAARKKAEKTGKTPPPAPSKKPRPAPATAATGS